MFFSIIGGVVVAIAAKSSGGSAGSNLDMDGVGVYYSYTQGERLEALNILMIFSAVLHL